MVNTTSVGSEVLAVTTTVDVSSREEVSGPIAMLRRVEGLCSGSIIEDSTQNDDLNRSDQTWRRVYVSEANLLGCFETLATCLKGRSSASPRYASGGGMSRQNKCFHFARRFSQQYMKNKKSQIRFHHGYCEAAL